MALSTNIISSKTSWKYIRFFDQLSSKDLALVGGKNASLGEMFSSLGERGILVPPGFALTTLAFKEFLQANHLQTSLKDLLKDLDKNNIQLLRSRGERARQLFLDHALPADIEGEIKLAYHHLAEYCSSKYPTTDFSVAVRSSATAEDLPTASFAGQQETYLNVRGISDLLLACRRCFASLYTDRAISYRIDQNFAHEQVFLSVGVQMMVRSDVGAAGVMFTVDTESGFDQLVMINAAYGLGENVVQGAVTPDEYAVFKPTLLQEKAPIIKKNLGTKELRMIYAQGGNKQVQNISVDAVERQKFALSEEEILSLARWAVSIEQHYSKQRNQYTPMDIEWAKDGMSGQLFITQARPETVQSQKVKDSFEIYKLKQHSKALVKGSSVGAKIATGKVRVIKDVHLLQDLKDGEVLVTDRTDPDWEPFMKRASAIVSNRGGRTCHAAIVSRELGLPAIVGAKNATEILQDGQMVTVSCAEGEVGVVFDGCLPFQIDNIQLKELKRPTTKIMMNVANPETVLQTTRIPNDGAGLVRMEFIISAHIGIHPMALIKFEQLSDKSLQTEIGARTSGYTSKPQFFIDKLAQGIAMIAAAFYPREVIVRTSDFKTNEYANLLGGKDFEPHEENPMLGFRGASRYYHDSYRDGFALECLAIKKVRETMGFSNVKMMIPFCRTPAEGRKVIAEINRHGLLQGHDGFEIYVMCEIPSNVLLADEFAKIFDGFSIGSNDLTQLILGVDRDSEMVAPLFDERSPAVKGMIAQAIAVAHRHQRKIGICGQAPSDYPEFAKFLVDQGIDSISLNPDVVLATTLLLTK